MPIPILKGNEQLLFTVIGIGLGAPDDFDVTIELQFEQEEN